MRTHLITAAAILVGALALGGCVSKKNYATLQQDYKTLSERCSKAELDLASCNSDTRNLSERLSREQQNNRELQEVLRQSMENNAQGNVNISKLVDEINASNKYIKELVSAKAKSDSLNLLLTSNLTRSLSPGELSDVNIKVLKGVVYISLADNMLYRSGSYEISPAAMDILGKIAKIIKDYRNYDVLVEGNTDNVPIKRTNIRNNWDLSALRASSVVQALQNDFGVDPSRLSAAGRGEYNPVADNESPSGRQLNRRTQIIITPKLDQFLDLIDKAPDTDHSN